MNTSGNVLDSRHCHMKKKNFASLKGLSYEIDFKNVDENLQILALIRAAAGFEFFGGTTDF